MSHTVSSAKKAAREALKHRPRFELVKFLPFDFPLGRQKLVRLKCLRCEEVSDRSLYWLTSDWDCMCNRGSRISKSSMLPESVFFDRCGLEKRKLRLRSKFKGLNYKVKVECLRCNHIWMSYALNVQKGHGCPKCAPALARKRFFKTYGVESVLEVPEFKEKRRLTMVERYGTEHALQNRTLFDKMVYSSYSCKSYRLGKKTVKVQGYEPQALDYIVNVKNIKPTKIECGVHNSKVPQIPYRFNGIDRVYHPDIFIPSRNLIVEVKSTYSDKRNKEATKRKGKACLAAGYRFKVLVMAKNGDLVYEY